MAITGIGGIFFKSNDPKALADWYETHLGVRRDQDGYSVLGWRLLDKPDVVGETVWSPFASDTKYFAPSEASWMVNFRVDDLDAMLKTLTESGVEVVGEPEVLDYGKFGWILDLEGNKVELWEPFDPQFTITVPQTDELTGEWLCEPGTEMAASPSDGTEIVKTTEVTLTPSAAWRLWTTSEGLSEWLIENSRVELRVGGPYEFYFYGDAPEGQRGGEGNKILSYLPDRMLSFTWNAPPELDYARPRLTHVVVEFDKTDTGTAVTLTHLGWPAGDEHPQWPETKTYFESAWDRVMQAFSTHCA